MANNVFEGQRILIEVEFRLNGVPTDPTVVTVASHSPTGVQSTVTYPAESFIRRSAGLYEASILVNEHGTWTFRSEGAGIVDAVNEMTQEVLASGFTG